MSFLQSTITANKEIFELIQTQDKHLKEYVSCNTSELGAGGDRTLRVDKMAEDIFLKHLSKYGKIYSEEIGEFGYGEHDVIIDPIDGSANFLCDFPYYGTSACLRDKNGKPITSVVCNMCGGDIFYRDETGLWKSNILKDEPREIIPTRNEPMHIGIFEKSYKNRTMMEKLLKTHIRLRSPGAIALSLAYAHVMSFVVFNGKHRDYDVMAGLHICEDLHIFNGDDMIIVSKDEDVFAQLKGLLL